MKKEELIESLKQKGFNEKIINAFNKVKREEFMLEELKDYAYEDNAFPIGYGQTISQPYTIAFMLSLLELKDNLKILEIGSGSGYVLCLLNEISKNSKIIGIERIKELAEKSKEKLKIFNNIKIIYGNALKFNLKEKFDRILVSAASDKIEKKFLNMLKKEGILVMPIKNYIVKIKKNKKLEIEKYYGFVFVPLVKE
ncbi:MAG: protein-L-isoaspartate O-methyltransferase [Candidatus Pacearchaeota archaeon]